MSPAQHTKGPWRLTHGNKHDGDRYVMSASSRIIVSVDGGPNDDSETFANARLIAAAPELLAALEAILAESDHDGYGARTDAQIPRLRAALGTARTAIAKAKGGAS